MQTSDHVYAYTHIPYPVTTYTSAICQLVLVSRVSSREKNKMRNCNFTIVDCVAYLDGD